MIIIGIKKISEDYFEGILNLWKNNFGEEFRVTENMLREKIFEDIDTFKEGSYVLLIDNEIKGIIVTKVNRHGLEEYKDCAWISTLLIDGKLQNRGYGSKLLNMAEEKLEDYGIRKIYLGGEMNNFFSGIPAPQMEKIDFFRKRGYFVNNEDHYDLMADVSKIDFDELKVKKNESNEFKTFEFTIDYKQKLDEFFDKTFPGRWKYEMDQYIQKNEELRNILILLHKDEVVGFCKIFIAEKESEYTLIYGENYGSLGPIGISESFRGKGVGNRILCDSLKLLKRRGAHNVLIDWTILKDFYGQFGFKPFKTYRGGYKSRDL